MADGSGYNISVPRPMLAFAQPADHKVAYGGRGGGKSWAVAQMLIQRAIQKPIRVLCAREVQKSIKDSVHKLLADQIKASGWAHLFDIQATTIKCLNGSEFVFAGLQDHTVDSIKSFEGVDICWVEEAQSVTDMSANILVPTIRKEGSEIWWTFNPTDSGDYVYKRFVKDKDPTAIVVHVGWQDNRRLSRKMAAERDRLRAINEDLYRHVWEGECRSVAGLLFKRKAFKFYDRLPENLSLYMASDYAGGPDINHPERDPDFTEHGVWGLDAQGDLYAVDWWYGQEDPEVWITAAVALLERHKPKVWFEEKGVILRALDSAISKRLKEKKVYPYRHELPSAGNKMDRALGFAARVAAGTVWLPKNEWGERLLNQLCAFTGEDGKKDDGVDVCSLVARGLDLMVNARLPKAEESKPLVPFSRRHIEGKTWDEVERDEQRRGFYS